MCDRGQHRGYKLAGIGCREKKKKKNDKKVLNVEAVARKIRDINVRSPEITAKTRKDEFLFLKIVHTLPMTFRRFCFKYGP